MPTMEFKHLKESRLVLTAKSFLLIVLSIYVQGCASLGENQNEKDLHYLDLYLAEKAYTPLLISRDGVGVGTIISFEGGVENVIWRNSECLNFDDNPMDIAQYEVSLPSRKFSSNNLYGIENTLADDVSEFATLKGAFSDSRIDSVSISFYEPNEQLISDGAVVKKIDRLIASKEKCVQSILKQGNYVIDRVLVANGFSYTFTNSADQSIALDVDILKLMKLAPDAVRKYNGETILVSQNRRILGYRLFEYKVGAGISSSGILKRRISKKEVEDIRQNSLSE